MPPHAEFEDEYSGLKSWQTAGYTEIPLISDYTENVSIYFKVANAVQNLEMLNVGKVMETAVLRTSLTDGHVVIETYVNGYSWYRVWSDGWCEQGGLCTMNSNWTNHTFLKPFKDMTYSIFVQFYHSANTSYSTNPACVAKVSTSQFQSGLYSGQASWAGTWYACGYIG